ncbi:zinc-ribbon domain-containing protein [Streptomyces althioticus]
MPRTPPSVLRGRVRWPGRDVRRKETVAVGTVRITDANRLSIVKPGLAETLNVDRSGITADSLTVASNRRVWWNCPDFPEHEPWKAVVNNRTGGFRKR